MSAKHTPGKWQMAVGVGLGAEVRVEPSICRVYGRPTVDEQNANARLIAAAPDLYDALEACADELVRLSCVVGDEDFDIIRGVEAQARAALSKAAPEEDGDAST